MNNYIDFMLRLMSEINLPVPTKKFIGVGKVRCDGFGDGYDHLRMRADVAKTTQRMFNEIEHGLGVPLSTSGGLRAPNVNPNKNQVATSSHTIGLAFDLWVYGGGFRSENRFVVVKDGRYWTVYGLSTRENIPEINIEQWDHKTQSSYPIKGRYVNLTKIFKSYGFVRIPHRRRYPRKYGSMEWWHFQKNDEIEVGSTYGEMLLKVWKKSKLVNTNAFAYRNYVWNGKRFVRP